MTPDLLKAHLEMREIVINDMQLTLVPELSLQQMLESFQLICQRIRGWNQSVSPISLLAMNQWNPNPQRIHVGDYFRNHGSDELMHYFEKVAKQQS